MNIGQGELQQSLMKLHCFTRKRVINLMKVPLAHWSVSCWILRCSLQEQMPCWGNIVNNSTVNSSDISFDESDSDSSNSLSEHSDSEDDCYWTFIIVLRNSQSLLLLDFDDNLSCSLYCTHCTLHFVLLCSDDQWLCSII